MRLTLSTRPRLLLACAIALLLQLHLLHAAQRQVLHGHIPDGVARARVLQPLSRSTRLNLAIGLPLRNQDQLEILLQQLSDPTSPNYQQYLTPEQFTAQFGPTEEDYQALIAFAESNGLVVTETHPNRMILDVTGASSDIEKTFHVNMLSYRHPVRGTFYAPDREPSLDLDIQALDISGLDNFDLPRPMSMETIPLSQAIPLVTGSGPAGLFIGKDFRAAYAPGVTLTGAGQVVGLVEFDGFYASDVQANFKQAALPFVQTQTVLLDGVNGAPGSGNIEVTLDIMMAAYMAPGLSKVIVYEGSNPNDILNRMATDNLAQQLSSSWTFSPINGTTEQIFKQYIAQGQSFFQASGDSGAYKGSILTPADEPNVTVVGGTSLTTSGTGGPWQSESTWGGSGGGISAVYPIPGYQQGLNMAANGGSATMRNIPDVSLTAAVQIFLIQNNGQAVAVGGTSAATPLWAGFMALANQQTAAAGKPRVGFLNPLIYAIGKGLNHAADLHDIVLGNNSGFPAISGYDLATGWGTPAGQHLIDDLSSAAGSPGFTLFSSQTALAIRQGGSGSSAITVTPLNGFNGSVSLTASGLPAGVTASFSPASTNSASTLTFTVSASGATGTSIVTVTGSSGALKSSTTIALTITAPSFSLSMSPDRLGINQGSKGSSTITATSQDFSNSINLSASGLPSGVTVSFGPGLSAATAVITLAASASAVAGTSTVTITGTSGSLVRTTTIELTILTAGTVSVPVNMTSVFNITALVNDGSRFAGAGLDGALNGVATAYSANLLGAQQNISGTTFIFGPANAPDAVSSRVVPLPSGQYLTLKLLATAVNGSQVSQSFIVTYTDGTTSVFTQNLSDWFAPRTYTGESKALSMPYRDTSTGLRDNRTFALYGYSFGLNGSKKVSSITLPNNRNVIVLAISLSR